MQKKERSKQGHTNNKAKQHNTHKVVTFPNKNELPRVGLEPMTLYSRDRALCLGWDVYLYVSSMRQIHETNIPSTIYTLCIVNILL